MSNHSHEVDKSGEKIVVGVKVAGACVTNGFQLSLEDLQFCEPVPIARAIGIPLFVQIVANESPPDSSLYSISRFMSTPETGFCPMHWLFGGTMGPAPVVALGRLDGLPFTHDCFYLLDDFEMRMLDEGPRYVGPRDFDEFISEVGPRDFDEFISETDHQEHEEGYEHERATIGLAWKFPPNCMVMARGLKSNTDLNGQLGKVIGKYQQGRVGVQFRSGIKALIKPQNIQKIKKT